MDYCVVVADAVRSRRRAEPERLQSALEAAAKRIGRTFENDLAAGPTITSGDEIQVLLRSPGRAFEVIFDVADGLYPLELRFGVGRGELATPLRPTTGSLSGPVFYRAREAIERAERQGWTAVFEGFGRRSETLSVLADCALSITRGWTSAQRDSARAFLRHGSHEAAAKALGLHRTTVTRNLNRGLVRQFVRCRDEAGRLLQETAGGDVGTE